MSPFVTWRSVVQATGPYYCENVKTDVFAVYTNNNYTGAMRGFRLAAGELRHRVHDGRTG